jgi:hypothetical protein
VAQDNLSNSVTVASRDWSQAQRAAVIEEMNRILSHPVFKGSDRCVALLRYLINLALVSGDTEIKERTLGIEVFGRTAGYDVSTDPIVRRIASEVRKRLAQYYQERGNDSSVRIDLIRGSYLPEFEFALERLSRKSTDAKDSEETPEAPNQSEPVIPHLETPPDSTPKVLQRWWILGIAAAALIGFACFALMRVSAFYSPVYRVWEPLLNSGDTITVCLPIHDSSPGDTGTADSGGSTTFRDVKAGSIITELLTNFKKHPDVRPSTVLRFRDFHENPAVLIGGLNNPWVPVLLSKLRFSVQYDSNTGDKWVQDAQNPGKRDWKIKGKSQSGDIPTDADYAVITRVYDQESSQWIMSLSGLQAKGTEEAAELVSDAQYSKLLPTSILKQGNFQIVLKVSLIGGEPGPLQILAIQTW